MKTPEYSPSSPVYTQYGGANKNDILKIIVNFINTDKNSLYIQDRLNLAADYIVT